VDLRATDLFSMSKHQPFGYSPVPELGCIRIHHLSPPVSANVTELRSSPRLRKVDGPSRYEAGAYAWGEFPKFDQVVVLDEKKKKN
jgi:hypothetical protein